MKNTTSPIILLLLSFVFFTNCKTDNASKTVSATISEIDKAPTIEEMIGQMLMVGFRGMDMKEVSPKFIEDIKEGKIGGTVLFDYDVVNKEYVRNIKSPEQVKNLISGLQSHAKIPLMMAVDQEGGKVNRLKAKYGFPESVSNKYLGQLNNLDSTAYYADRNAKSLKELGFNVNFSPAVDLDLNPKNPVIGKYERSYSKDPEIVINHSNVWIKAHEAQGILSTLKHFPGHGSSDADSHEGFTDVTAYWQEVELTPFKEILQKDQLVAVMTAHVFNAKLDSLFPATLSPKVIDQFLRKDWKFNGLVFSDDLHMNAVNELFDFKTIIKRSILSGVDILVYGNNLKYDENIPEKTTSTILELIKNGELSESRIKESYERIMEVKRKY